MQEFFPEIEIRDDQAQAIARGLIAVAKADGELHAREAAMITEFFASVTDSMHDISALVEGDPIEATHLAMQLPGAELRQLFVKTALLLAYADGTYGEGEAKLIGEYAAALDIDAEGVAEQEARVKEFLLSQLSHLANVEAVAEVAKELEV